jgi:hypothetical protein
MVLAPFFNCFSWSFTIFSEGKSKIIFLKLGSLQRGKCSVALEELNSYKSSKETAMIFN